MAVDTQGLEPIPVVANPTVTHADTTAHDDQVRASLAGWALLRSAVLIILIVGGSLAFLAYGEYTGKKFDPALYTLMGTAIGAVITNEYAIITAAWQYYFGSSSGSTAKSVAQEKKAA